MSRLWREAPTGGWESMLLSDETVLPGEDPPVEGVRFLRYGSGLESGVVLITRPGVRAWVNGQPVLGGLRRLQHQDEIIAGRLRLYYSAESTPVVVTFRLKEGTRAPTCPVCRGPVKDGQQAVQCPGCSRWYHQLDAAEGKPAKHCWTYADTCLCKHPTSLSGESAWRPEMEESNV